MQQTTCANASLFDHLVGNREQRRRHGEAEHPGSLGVDDQLELGRLHDRQVRGLGALEYATGIDTNVTKRIRNVDSVPKPDHICNRIPDDVRERIINAGAG
jgi:hypothetical protein